MFKEVKQSIDIFEETQKNQVQTTPYQRCVLHKPSYSIHAYTYAYVTVNMYVCLCIVQSMGIHIYFTTNYMYVFAAQNIDLVQQPLVMCHQLLLVTVKQQLLPAMNI